MPEKIALITSGAGAAVQDMIRILGRRWPLTKILVMPVRVQGTEAPAEIAGAIRYANRWNVADLIITGEGRLDGQTVMGKAPIGVAKLAKEYGKPVIAFSGCVTKDASACNAAGIDAFFPILRNIVTLQEAMDHDNAEKNMIATVEQVFRTIKTFS